MHALLQTLLSGVQAVLGNNLIGLYIHGSLALGDFDPERSDIDFVVVTHADLPAELLPVLEAMHADIARSGLKWATNYEGSYIPQCAIRRYDPAHSRHPALDIDGTFGMDDHRSEWVIQRHIIREHGIALTGPAPATLIDPITPDDLKQATLRLLQEWWAPQLHNPYRLQSSEYQAYAILTMCRALYTLTHGTITTKSQAARWAQQNLDPKWTPLIVQGLTWRHGTELHSLDKTLNFIRHTTQR